jgi:hypothetical protein
LVSVVGKTDCPIVEVSKALTVMLIRTSSSSQGYGHPMVSPAPFVVGVMRSGTTLLRLMLDAHPDVAIPSETRFIPDVADKCRGASDPRATFVAALTSHERWPIFHIPADLLAERIARMDPFSPGEGLRAFFHLYAEKFGKPRWGDKSPGYSRYMLLIQELLPEARFIHLIRDGRDIALSVAKLRQNADPDTLARAAELWVLRIATARAQVKHLGHYLEIRYEDLILDPESTLGAVAAFIALPWNPAMLTYHENSAERMSELFAAPASILNRRGGDPTTIHQLTAKPPQRDRIGVWRREMSATDQARFVEIAGEGLQEFGYPVESHEPYPSPVQTVRFP